MFIYPALRPIYSSVLFLQLCKRRLPFCLSPDFRQLSVRPIWKAKNIYRDLNWFNSESHLENWDVNILYFTGQRRVLFGPLENNRRETSPMLNLVQIYAGMYSSNTVMKKRIALDEGKQRILAALLFHV